MSDFKINIFSYYGRKYTSEETISFSQCPLESFPTVSKEMQFHLKVKNVQVSCLTQAEFDEFVLNYADNYESIYFFQNPKVKDLSALSKLKNVKYLLFYNFRLAKQMWDMSNNLSLKGLFFSESKNIVYDISAISNAPALEEFVIWSNMNSKYTVKSLEPIKCCNTLKRVEIDCKTENQDFEPNEFSQLDYLSYRVDRRRGVIDRTSNY